MVLVTSGSQVKGYQERSASIRQVPAATARSDATGTADFFVRKPARLAACIMTLR